MAEYSLLAGDLLDRSKETDGSNTLGPDWSIDVGKEDKGQYESPTDDQENEHSNNSPGSAD